MIADVEAKGKEEVVVRTRPVRSTRTVVAVRSLKLKFTPILIVVVL